MSRSNNTKPIKYKVNKNPNENSEIDFPRIIERKPKYGDVHPLTKEDIIEYLSKIPREFFFDLKSIELKARKNKPGSPWGSYFFSDKKVVIYSQPLRSEYDILMSFVFAEWMEIGKSVPPSYTFSDDKFFANWDTESLKGFFLEEILPHELGHHYYYINKKRRKLPIGKFHEILAEIYKDKINNSSK